jgi:hypothetical protein
MPDEMYDFGPGMTAWEIDRFADPFDDAEALTMLLEERIAEARADACDLCGGARPCECDRPFTREEHDAMERRYVRAKEWQS